MLKYHTWHLDKWNFILMKMNVASVPHFSQGNIIQF